ncbi:hypothetical protein [Bacillus weihaiensis]|uniref:Uncharacterized protein n=1 Tax=Bacillus weihaiensis TaxID=1547283 RepID=A0A1L3MRE6_9BACI|nr:hypothetical protein [Bacillus weihaiensis]APH04930.1 hypothetical protein A9C19_09310 [Bacillus weihaiensis]
MKEYAVYKGEDLLAIGTAKECAETLNVAAETIYYYTTSAYKRKLEKRKNPDNCRVAILMDNE